MCTSVSHHCYKFLTIERRFFEPLILVVFGTMLLFFQTLFILFFGVSALLFDRDFFQSFLGLFVERSGSAYGTGLPVASDACASRIR